MRQRRAASWFLLMTESLNRTDFSQVVGTTFRVRFDAGEDVQLELAQCDPLAAPARETASREAPFALLLRGSPQVQLPQQIHIFEHERLGTFEMFIVPVGPGEYEAVFN